jgi:hypothetical protein
MPSAGICEFQKVLRHEKGTVFRQKKQSHEWLCFEWRVGSKISCPRAESQVTLLISYPTPPFSTASRNVVFFAGDNLRSVQGKIAGRKDARSSEKIVYGIERFFAPSETVAIIIYTFIFVKHFYL